METLRDFEQLRAEYTPFAGSTLGELYFRAHERGSAGLVVRHFKGARPERAAALAHLAARARFWVTRRDSLMELLRIEQPVEFGTDFVARPHHVYYVSTRSYVADERPPEVPTELEQMRSVFRSECASVHPEDELMLEILARAVLDPSGKTYFNDDEGRFVVVELSPTAAELDRLEEMERSRVVSGT